MNKEEVKLKMFSGHPIDCSIAISSTLGYNVKLIFSILLKNLVPKIKKKLEIWLQYYSYEDHLSWILKSRNHFCAVTWNNRKKNRKSWIHIWCVITLYHDLDISILNERLFHFSDVINNEILFKSIFFVLCSINILPENI